MLLADVAMTPAGALDMERLKIAIESTEEGLRAAKREMTPSKKAELVLAVYDLLDDTSSATRERVLKLVKLAA